MIALAINVTMGPNYLSREVDGFSIRYFPASEDPENQVYQDDIFYLFGIKATKGCIMRKCLECNDFCTLDGETFDNYIDYVIMRNAFAKNAEKDPRYFFRARFHFHGCAHPITPLLPENTENTQIIN